MSKGEVRAVKGELRDIGYGRVSMVGQGHAMEVRPQWRPVDRHVRGRVVIQVATKSEKQRPNSASGPDPRLLFKEKYPHRRRPATGFGPASRTAGYTPTPVPTN